MFIQPMFPLCALMLPDWHVNLNLNFMPLEVTVVVFVVSRVPVCHCGKSLCGVLS
jgi:hypothetical protein